MLAVADLQLTVSSAYPVHLDLKIPVEEDSDFTIETTYGGGSFFSATGHIGRVTGIGTNRTVDLTYGYHYKFGESHGSSSGGMQEQPLTADHPIHSVRPIASIWGFNPGFRVQEVPAPAVVVVTNFTPLAKSPTRSQNTVTNETLSERGEEDD